MGQNLDLSTASLWEIASQLLKLNVFQTHQARNAYSALLLIPGLDQLRFPPLLKQIKRGWNQSVPKYATFWSGSNLLKKLATQALDWTSPSQIRDRLILSWRLVQICRSIDLARLFRKVTMVDGRPFVWIQRKGWTQPRWEEVLCLPPPLPPLPLDPAAGLCGPDQGFAWCEPRLFGVEGLAVPLCPSDRQRHWSFNWQIAGKTWDSKKSMGNPLHSGGGGYHVQGIGPKF